jgi:hypothetical protein
VTYVMNPKSMPRERLLGMHVLKPIKPCPKYCLLMFFMFFSLNYCLLLSFYTSMAYGIGHMDLDTREWADGVLTDAGALSYYLTILLSCYLTILLSYYLAILLSYYLTILLSCYLAILLSCYLAILLSCYLAILLSCYLAILLSYYLAILLCYYVICQYVYVFYNNLKYYYNLCMSFILS